MNEKIVFFKYRFDAISNSDINSDKVLKGFISKVTYDMKIITIAKLFFITKRE